MERGRYSTAYYESFLIAIILSWLPFKILSYFSPFVVLFWFILKSNSGRTLLKSFFLLLLYGTIVSLYFSLSHILGFKYLIQNSIFALLTYGSFFFLLCTPGNISLDEPSYLKIKKIIGFVITAEAIVGIFQFLIAILVRGFGPSMGDVVQGTIYTLSFLETIDMGLGNQIFTINMALMILFYLPYVLTYKKGYLTLSLGTISLLLASVTHVIIPMLLAFFIVWLFFRKNILGRLKTKHLMFAIIFSGIFFLLYRSQSELITYYVTKFAQIESLKAKATINSLRNAPHEYPSSIFVGLGPGQFSSRASLIGTGRYFTNQRSIPFLRPDMTPAFEKFIDPYYNEYLTNPTYGNSTMSRPFHSMLSIALEFGLIFFVIISFLFASLLFSLRKFFLKGIEKQNQLTANIAFVGAIALLLLLFISFFENYLEVTQAIFPGLILLKIFYKSLKMHSLSRNNNTLR